MRTHSYAAVLLAGLLAASPLALAHNYHRSYAGGVTPVFGVVVCDDQGLGFDIGGTCAPPVDEPYYRLSIRDRSETPGTVARYALLACQDTNDDGLCGDFEEPSVAGCGTEIYARGSRVPFHPGVPIYAFTFTSMTLDDGTVCTSTPITTGEHWHDYEHA